MPIALKSTNSGGLERHPSRFLENCHLSHFIHTFYINHTKTAIIIRIIKIPERVKRRIIK